MARTYRRKHLQPERWVLREWVNDESDTYAFRRIDPKSVEGKKRIALYHADSDHYFYNGIGPSWFYTLFCQKPYRQRARQELHKFKRNPEYEVLIEDKPHQIYWD